MNFEVRGVDVRTGQPVAFVLVADSVKHAEELAMQQGVKCHFVRAIDQSAPQGPGQTAPTATYPTPHWSGIPRTTGRSTRSGGRDAISIGQVFGAAGAGVMTLVLLGLAVVVGWKWKTRAPETTYPLPAALTASGTPLNQDLPIRSEPAGNADATLDYWKSLVGELPAVVRAPDQFRFDFDITTMISKMQDLEKLTKSLDAVANRIRNLDPSNVDSAATDASRRYAAKIDAMRKELADAISPAGMSASGFVVGQRLRGDSGGGNVKLNHWETCQERFASLRDDLVNDVAAVRTDLSQRLKRKFPGVPNE